MGGGGGGIFGGGYSPDRFKKIIQASREKTHDEELETTVNSMITERVSDVERDADTTRERLDDIKEKIQEEDIGTIEMRFGGSVMKHTYVDGLSDVDVLVIINKSDLSDSTPREVLDYIKTRLEKSGLRNVDNIRVGNLAVTVTFNDGEEIQLLPAIKKGDGYMIPAQKGDNWSNIIRPDRFATKLKEVNQSCKGKVYPVIKIVKTINSRLPEDQKLSGYHIESIAIEVFENYPESNAKTPKVMLRYFFENAKAVIKTPIKDKTNQSLHVDDDLGPENSPQRLRIGYSLDRIGRMMRNADEIRSTEEWDSILGE